MTLPTDHVALYGSVFFQNTRDTYTFLLYVRHAKHPKTAHVFLCGSRRLLNNTYVQAWRKTSDSVMVATDFRSTCLHVAKNSLTLNLLQVEILAE